MVNVLLIDDDLEAAELLALVLKQAGLVVVRARDIDRAMELWSKEAPDLLVIDANSPETDVLSMCRTLRRESPLPIVVLSHRTDEQYALQAFNTGIDEYIIKPYSPKLLIARIRAILRRARGVPLSTLATLTAGPFRLDPERRSVSLPQKAEVHLTNLEFRLLYVLISNRGHVVPTEVLVEKVWGYSGAGDTTLLRGLISRLRQKVELDPRSPRYVQTVPGVGYAIAFPSQEQS